MRACRVDRNQSEITAALRKVGCTVAPTHVVGDGFPDLVVGFRGVNHLLEVKDGLKPASKRELTEPEKKFHIAWRGAVHIVYSVDDALRVVTGAVS